MPQIYRTPAAVICAAVFTAALSLSGCGPTGPSGAVSDTTTSQSPTAAQSPAATPSPTKSPTPEPVTTIKEITKKEAVPFEKVTRNDPNLDKGTKKVTTQGVEGVRTKTFRVTYVDGEETDRELIDAVVSEKPVDQVTSIGTRQPPPPPEPEEPEQSNCDPNYSGCVPIASDVDCAGGSGNGPAYVRGPVRVIGSDIYDLDRDGDGVGCDT